MKIVALMLLLLSFSCVGQQNFKLSDSLIFVGQRYEMHRFQIYVFDGVNENVLKQLDSMAVLLKKNDLVKIEVRCYSDSRGKDSVNLRTTTSIAMQHVNYLISKGVNPKQLVARGFGETEPIIPEEEINHYRKTNKKLFEKLHQTNRRLEYVVVKRVLMKEDF